MARRLLILALGLSLAGGLLAMSHRDLAWAGGFGLLSDTCLVLLVGLWVSERERPR